MDPKQLKKLAKACREAGISHFKCAEFEFSLTETAPVKENKKASQDTGPQGPIESDMPSPEALLFWSSQGIDTEPTGEA